LGELGFSRTAAAYSARAAFMSFVDAATAVLRPRKRAGWQFALSSNQPIYGGEQPGLYDPHKKEFSLIQPEAIVFLEEGEFRPQP